MILNERNYIFVRSTYPGQYIEDDGDYYKVLDNHVHKDGIELDVELPNGSKSSVRYLISDQVNEISKSEFDSHKPVKKLYYVYRIGRLDKNTYDNMAYLQSDGKTYKYRGTKNLKLFSKDEADKFCKRMNKYDEYYAYHYTLKSN